MSPVQQFAPVEPVRNPWGESTAYRPFNLSDGSAADLPQLRYTVPQGNSSRYAAFVVAPAGVPQYSRNRVADPVPAIPGNTLPET